MSSILVQVIVGGLLLGAVYALFSSGLTLIWGMMNIVNFAHGDFVMREVDDVHHAPDQREAGREQRIDRAQQQPADDDLDKNRRHGALRLFRRTLRWPAADTIRCFARIKKAEKSPTPSRRPHQPLKGIAGGFAADSSGQTPT